MFSDLAYMLNVQLLLVISLNQALETNIQGSKKGENGTIMSSAHAILYKISFWFKAGRGTLAGVGLDWRVHCIENNFVLSVYQSRLTVLI